MDYVVRVLERWLQAQPAATAQPAQRRLFD